MVKAKNVLFSRDPACPHELTFWDKWLDMHELDQEVYIQSIVPVIEGHWTALEKIGKDVGSGEVIRLKASLLNSYFLDLLRTINVQNMRDKKKKKS